MPPHFEFLLEEQSMEAFLHAWLPDFLGEDITFSTHPFQGKPDLLGKLERRLAGYSRWLPENRRLVIVVDRDNDDCAELKKRLEAICSDAGLRSRSVTGPKIWQVVTRIAVEELEAWYFGDWQAVRAAYPNVSSRIPGRAKFRRPDEVRGGTSEQFERVMQGHGYHAGGLRKAEAAREIGSHIDDGRSTSPSFRCLANVLREVVT